MPQSKWKREKSTTEKVRSKNRIHSKWLLFLLAMALFTVSTAGCQSEKKKEEKNQETENVQEEETVIPIEMEGILETNGEDYSEESLHVSEEMHILMEKILEKTHTEQGIWNVYLKNMKSGEVICTGDESLYAASLIKLFVMEYWMEQIRENPDLFYQEDFRPEGSLELLLAQMIEQSDNDAYNLLIQKITPSDSFEDGCKMLNNYLKEAGYMRTGVFHTLHPSDSEYISIGNEEEKNYTCVSECGRLLEKIYQGITESDEIAWEMMEFLQQQETMDKIPQPLPGGIVIANKTGETDEVQHDAAIICGPDVDYILCVMSSGIKSEEAAVDKIQELSELIFYELNPSALDWADEPDLDEDWGEDSDIDWDEE